MCLQKCGGRSYHVTKVRVFFSFLQNNILSTRRRGEELERSSLPHTLDTAINCYNIGETCSYAQCNRGSICLKHILFYVQLSRFHCILKNILAEVSCNK